MKRKVYRKSRRTKKRKVGVPYSMTNRTSRIRVAIMCQTPIAQPGAGGGGYGNNQSCYALNLPTYNRIAAGTYGQMTTIPSNWPLYLTVFDMYRVRGLEIKYIPDEMEVHPAAVVPNTVDAPTLVYHYNDPDDISSSFAETDFLNAGSNPVHAQQKNVLLFRHKNPDKEWLNTGAVTITPAQAVTQDTVTHPRIFASTKLFFTNLQYPAAAGGTYYYGRVYAKWIVEFKGIRQ